MSSRQLTPEEEKLEEGVWAAWEDFLFQMQDASEFVKTQTPIITQRLQDTFMVKSSLSHTFWSPLKCEMNMLNLM